MVEDGFKVNKSNTEDGIDDKAALIERIENAYRIYKLSEVFLNDVSDDYGKLKIARLRLDFARHELITLIEEARGMGIRWDKNEMLKKFFFNA